MLNEKVMIICLIIGLIERKWEHFRKPKFLVVDIKVELDLSNYATKADLENLAGVNKSDFGNRTDLANLKIWCR